MKYGLPIPNLRPSVEDYTMQQAKDSLPNTVTMNMFEKLGLNGESSYEMYENACVESNGADMDMYGIKL
jgi:hypothetical protein